MKVSKAVSAIVGDTSIKWIDEQVAKGEFASRAHALRQCVKIAKRVYEEGTPKEIAKFVLGITR